MVRLGYGPRLDRSGPRPVGTGKGAAPVVGCGALWSVAVAVVVAACGGGIPAKEKAPIPSWHGRRCGELYVAALTLAALRRVYGRYGLACGTVY